MKTALSIGKEYPHIPSDPSPYLISIMKYTPRNAVRAQRMSNPDTDSLRITPASRITRIGFRLKIRFDLPASMYFND